VKVLKWSAAAIVVIAVVLLAVVYLYLRSTLPDYDSDVAAAGLDSEVEIIRDSYGMPHIYAATDCDAYFALGFCMAQDRLFQMDIVRRTVHGRLAEVLGERLIEADQLFRTITAVKSPEEMAVELPPEVRAALEAFSAGINYYLRERTGSLPVEFTLMGYEPENWQPADCAAVLYYMAWMLNFSFSTEMLYAAVIDQVGGELATGLFVDYPAGYPTIIPDTSGALQDRDLEVLRSLNLARELVGGDGRGASNSWVIGGSKAKTGAPILANDMHLGLGLPGIWYEAHLVIPEMNVSGVLAPGIPFVTVGANDHVAWGFTNVMADDADYYREKLNPHDPTQYEYLGRWEKMEIKKDTIPVKGGEDVPFEVRLTRHGPIISDFTEFEKPAGEALAMRWVLADLHQEATALYMLNRAQSVEDIEKAVEYFKCPGQNWVYADDQGNIGYWAAVGIPVREGFDGALPVPGWDGESEWAGYVPTAEQPHLKNPSRGWIASANNKHTADDYPYPISHYYGMPDRIERIERMLKEKDKLGIEDCERMHADLYLVLAEEWVPIMITALEKQSVTGTEMQAFEILKQWDFVAAPDAVAPTVFHATVGYMIEYTFRTRLGEELYGQYIKSVWRAHNALRKLIAGGESPWFDDPETPERERLTDIIRMSFAEAIKYLEEKMGENINRWRWGDLHTLTLAHPVSRQPGIRSGGVFDERRPVSDRGWDLDG